MFDFANKHLISTNFFHACRRFRTYINNSNSISICRIYNNKGNGFLDENLGITNIGSLFKNMSGWNFKGTYVIKLASTITNSVILEFDIKEETNGIEEN